MCETTQHHAGKLGHREHMSADRHVQWAWCARDRQVHRRHWTHVHISNDLKTCTECSQIELSDLDTWLAGSCSIALQRCVGGCIRFMVAQKNHISPRNGPSRILPKWGPSYLHFWLIFGAAVAGPKARPQGGQRGLENMAAVFGPQGACRCMSAHHGAEHTTTRHK